MNEFFLVMTKIFCNLVTFTFNVLLDCGNVRLQADKSLLNP